MSSMTISSFLKLNNLIHICPFPYLKVEVLIVCFSQYTHYCLQKLFVEYQNQLLSLIVKSASYFIQIFFQDDEIACFGLEVILSMVQSKQNLDNQNTILLSA
ncbi:hypothetical protein ABPG72_010448 [Tetrahymena utriculariae]